MKNWFLILVLITQISCEVIPLDETRESNSVLIDTTSTKKKVLLQYYTAHKCGNCPEKGGDVIKDLKALYGDDLILMSIHVGFLATPSSSSMYTYDFRTDIGNQFSKIHGASNTPSGVINEKQWNGSYIQTPTSWGSAISETLAEEALVFISGEVKQEENSIVRLDVNFQSNRIITDDIKIYAFAVENDVINWQKDYSKDQQDVPDYIHESVLRDRFILDQNEIQANEISNSTISINGTVSVQSDWEASNISAIVLAEDSKTGEVFQVEQIDYK